MGWTLEPEKGGTLYHHLQHELLPF